SVADQERRSLRFLPLLLRTLALGIPPLARILLSFDRIWRALWPDGWFRLQLIQQFRHTAFQLRVFALDDRFRIIFDRDVGVNAVAFDYPIAFSVGEAEFGDVDDAAVDERPAIGDANHAAPRTFADQRPQAGFAEHRREDVAVR